MLIPRRTVEDEFAHLLSPLTLAVTTTQELPEPYLYAAHLNYISERLVRLHQRQGKKRLLITAPPRHGKSELASHWFPTYALAHDPTTKIIMTSYELEQAVKSGRAVRRSVLENYQFIGARLIEDSRAAHRWETLHGGGMISAGVRGPITGKGAHIAICDDPIKNAEEANSSTIRDAVWDWWTTTFLSRLEPNRHGEDPIVILILCLAGDTPILRADGRETPLRDIRPGDEVATYENGRITSATVKNWANQGPDRVFKIRTKSGSVVRANARHPFLVVEDGVESWRKLQDLRVGDAIVRVTPPGAACEESSAPSATSQRSARACACTTTEKPDGPLATAHHLSILGAAVKRIFATVMGLTPQTTPGCLPTKAAPVLFAERPREEPAQSLTTSSSASTTTTPPEGYEGFSATAAISPLDTREPQASWPEPLSTYVAGKDTIVEISPCGTEDVYDIQIERTESFIANGLAAHNTRWHEDDLAGRVMAQPDFASIWDHIHLPAIAEMDDQLGRRPDEALWDRFDRVFLESKRAEMGSRAFQALYQGNPQPPGGIAIQRSWWRYYDAPPKPEEFDQLLISVDPTFKGNSDSDYVAMGVLGRLGSQFYLMDVTRKQMNGPDTIKAITGSTGYDKRWANLWLCIEDTASGSMICDILERDRGRVIRGKHKSRQKETRLSWQVNGAAALIERGCVWIQKDAGWAKQLVDEGAAFPHGKHDDMLDMLVQGLEQVLPRAWSHQNSMVRDATRRPPRDYVHQLSQQLHAAVKKRIALNQKQARKASQAQFPGF